MNGAVNLRKRTTKTTTELSNKKIKHKSKTPIILNGIKKSYICMNCTAKFNYKKGLINHKKFCKSNNNLIELPTLNKTKPPIKSLDENKQENVNNNITKPIEESPKVVDEEVTSINNNNNVASKDKEKSEYICNSCGLVCKTKATYTEHSKKHTIRVSKDLIKKYSETYDDVPPIECPICHREQTGARQAWLRHLDTHNSDICLYHCSVCKKAFRRADHRNNHEKRHVK